MPDNVLKLVLLGGSELEPASRPLLLDNPTGFGGLLRPPTVVNGGNILLTTNLTSRSTRPRGSHLQWFGVTCNDTRRSHLTGMPDPKETPIMPPSQPWIEPEQPDAPPIQPADPHKPWIAPTKPGESPVTPPDPTQPWVE